MVVVILPVHACVQFTIGHYLKHLMQYQDQRFSKHPRFRYFGLNTEMHWRALQAGQVYIRQNPNDALLTVSELKSMIGSESSALSNRILHFASALRGTCQYWMKQRSRLISMVNNLGLPTVFLTHSAADIHWSELAELICPNNPQDRAARTRAVIENPAIADCMVFFITE